MNKLSMWRLQVKEAFKWEEMEMIDLVIGALYLILGGAIIFIIVIGLIFNA